MKKYLIILILIVSILSVNALSDTARKMVMSESHAGGGPGPTYSLAITEVTYFEDNETLDLGKFSRSVSNNLIMGEGSIANFKTIISSNLTSFESFKLKVLYINDYDIAGFPKSVMISIEYFDINILPWWDILVFDMGEIKQVDVDNDNINDLEIVFNDLEENKADLTITSLMNSTELEKSDYQKAVSEYNQEINEVNKKIEENNEKTIFNIFMMDIIVIFLLLLFILKKGNKNKTRSKNGN